MKFAALILTTALSSSLLAQGPIYDPGNGVILPTIVKEVKATYTKRAKAKGVQGSVILTAVIEDDGSVGEVIVVKSLDPELDQQAIVALKQWEFRPGMRDGQPVAVRFSCELPFTLPRR